MSRPFLCYSCGNHECTCKPPADRFRVCGKQVLLGREDICQARNPLTAAHIASCLNAAIPKGTKPKIEDFTEGE